MSGEGESKTIHRELVLASSSPRRKILLEEMSIPFTVDVPNVEECDSVTHPDLTPAQIAAKNASLKAQVVSARHPTSCVLAADTIVVCGGKILGKPIDLQQADQMLRDLSGKTHEVMTAVTWVLKSKNIVRETVISTRVAFRALDELTIAKYLSLVHVLDKAGAYAIQEHGGMIIESVEGSRTNVIGLPTEIVSEWWQHPE